MKKLILILTILVVITNVLAITLDELNENNINTLTQEDINSLIKEYNALPKEEQANYNSKLQTLAPKIQEVVENMSAKELVTLALSTAQKPEIPEFAKKFLPFNIKINVLDKQESFIISLDKEGDINILDDAKSHILVDLNLNDILPMLQNTQNIKPEDIISKVKITPNSFKGALVLNAVEKITKLQIVNPKSFGYKTVGLLTAPVSLFVK